MTKVYVVLAGYYHDVYRIFKSKRKAEKYVEQQRKETKVGGWHIEEWKVE